MRKEIGVIGLGKFGLTVALTLKELGHRVVALEQNSILVQRFSHELDAVFSGDATDKSVLEQLRFQDLDQVVVGVGSSMESSIMIVLNLQDLKIANLMAKAATDQHALVLGRLGVRQVVQPEVEIARQVAHQINSPGLLDFLSLGGGTLLQKAVVKKWAGRTLADLKLPGEHRVMVVAEKDHSDRDFRFVPSPLTPLVEGTELLLIGPAAKILELDP